MIIPIQNAGYASYFALEPEPLCIALNIANNKIAIPKMIVENIPFEKPGETTITSDEDLWIVINTI